MIDDWQIEYVDFDDHKLNIKFGISSTSGDRYSFSTRNINLFDNLEVAHCDPIDLFWNNEGNMLDMAINLVSDGHFSDDSVFSISKNLFDQYFPG